MRKVVTINLNGNAYLVNEAGYEALRAYLDGAEERLAGNPDKAEIMSDLEQAIAEKCAGFLSEHKSVVSAAEVDQLLQEMGQVESNSGEAHARPSADSDGVEEEEPVEVPRRLRKRLYRIPEENVLLGVCAGFAAYFRVDVAIVRLIFVLLGLFTGVWIFVYLILGLVMPAAETSEELAAAHGEPFNAQELVDRARRKHTRPRSANLRHRSGRYWQTQTQRRNVSYGTQVAAGVLVPVLTALSAALCVAFLYAILSLVSTGTLFGWTFFGWAAHSGMRLWIGIVILTLVYSAMSSPLRVARRTSHYYANGGRYGSWYSSWDNLLWLALAVLFVWASYRYIPGVQELFQTLPFYFHGQYPKYSI